ncbi:hypothetical protein ACJ72_07409 [Emergomyces africanus]|uniref:Uncharacterized protein n=1 Tax=Emergomyces africanus TaxID=1955775 RepID=A0A1B7NNN5_9EURO|nr:hypothetical protein ACJ72_07409 [Emergomyces africanus]
MSSEIHNIFHYYIEKILNEKIRYHQKYYLIK